MRWINCFLVLFSASVTGRGCSTKDKVFYRECETHSYGDQIEKMCFCSFLLCNGGASSTVQPSSALFLLCLAAVLTLGLGGISRELNMQNHKPSSISPHKRGTTFSHFQFSCFIISADINLLSASIYFISADIYYFHIS